MSVSNSTASTADSFEEVVAQAQSSSNFKPLWNRLVKTKFFVSIVREPLAAKPDFQLHSWPTSDTAVSSIHISEYKDKLELGDGTEITQLSGAEIVRRAPSGMGIRLLLANRPLEVAAVRVDWLKKSLEASREALLKKKNEQAVVPPAPTPAAVVKTGDTLPPINAISIPAPSDEPNVVKSWDFRVSALPAEVEVPTQESQPESSTPAFNFQSLELESIKPAAKPVEKFDVSSLKSRHVTHAGLGVELFVPSAWQEMRNDKALKFVEQAAGIVVELNGRRRDDMSLESWMAMRLPLVTQEMPFLTKISETLEVKGRNWRDQIIGNVTEFRGRFPGDDVDSIYQICCIQTSKRLIAVCIRAPISNFDEQRALFKWLTEGVEGYEIPSRSEGQNSGGAREGQVFESLRVGDAPSFFSLSFAGRLGRLRFIVYSFMTAFAFVFMGIIAALLAREPSFILIATAVVLYIIMIYRPIVLRMHDFNMSGKWLLGLFLLLGTASVSRHAGFLMMANIVNLVFYLIVLFLPGSSDTNDYGDPCPPNLTSIKVTAWILIALSVMAAFASFKYARNSNFSFGGAKATAVKSGYGFTPENRSFTINFPVMPKEELAAAASAKGPGMDEVHIYDAQNNNFQYLVQEIGFENLPPDQSMALTKFADYFAARLGGEILETQRTMQGAFSARAVKIRLANGDQQDFRLFFVGKKLFVLGVQSPKDRLNSNEADTFFDSFQAN